MPWAHEAVGSNPATPITIVGTVRPKDIKYAGTSGTEGTYEGGLADLYIPTYSGTDKPAGLKPEAAAL